MSAGAWVLVAAVVIGLAGLGFGSVLHRETARRTIEWDN